MIPSLDAETAAVMAAAYDFSGGEIENIARKMTVEFILTGVKQTAEQMHEICRAEQLNKKSGRVGFKN